jgi:hypothetical protein
MSEFKFVATPSTAGTLAGTPVADFAQDDTKSDVVKLAMYEEVYFMVYWGVGTTGTLTLTAIPTTAASGGTDGEAIPFEYKRVSATETNTDWTAATTSGVLTTAGSDQMYICKVRAAALPDGYPYVYLNIAETVDDPLIGGCLIMLGKPRYDKGVLDNVTS